MTPAIALSPKRKLLRFCLWLTQAVLGAVAGYAVGSASLDARLTVLDRGGRVSLVRVEIRLWGLLVDQETGWVNTEDDFGPGVGFRLLSFGQLLWFHGVPSLGLLLGLAAALGSASLLVWTGAAPDAERLRALRCFNE